MYDVLCAKHFTQLRHILFVLISGLLKPSFANCSTLYNRFDIVAIKLFGCLCLQIYEIVWHLSKMQSKTDKLVQFMAVVGNKRLILLVHVPKYFVVNGEDLISLPLKAEIWQVLSPIDPVSNCSLYTQDDRYQNFLDHFGILNTLGISQHLLYGWIYFGPF